MSRHCLRRNSIIPLPQVPIKAITHLQLNGEGNNGQYSSFSIYFSTIPIFFSPCFFQLKCCLVIHASCSPWIWPTIGHPLPASSVRKAATVSILPVYIFSSISNVFHDNFQLICCSVSCAGCPPSVDRENKSPTPPSPVCELNGEGGNGE